MISENDIRQQFLNTYLSNADAVAYAPARINLIGDHADYNDGFALPCAINFFTSVAASIRRDKQIYVYAVNYETKPIVLTDTLLKQQNYNGWLAYVAGSIDLIRQQYGIVKGMNVLISGNVPREAGLSSSASLEIALLKCFDMLFDLHMSPETAAKLGQDIEHIYAGCQCGIMDQLASASCKQGNAMLLDCKTLEHKQVPIPDELGLLIVNSNIPRTLINSEYNNRREQCKEAAALLGVNSLRSVSLKTLRDSTEALGERLYRRVFHVLTENNRVKNTVVAFTNNNISQLNSLMAESHASLRDNYEVSTKEIDQLVDILNDKLRGRGGARMTGGGFGGCVLAIGPKSLMNELAVDAKERYLNLTNIEADTYICHTQSGAFSSDLGNI